MKKIELNNVFQRCYKEKSFNNNVEIHFDSKKSPEFGSYLKDLNSNDLTEMKLHNASFDAYMTGHSFIALSKYIEIGKILQISDDIKMS